MAKSLTYYLKPAIILQMLAFSCSQPREWYRRELSTEEKVQYGQQVRGGGAYHYQGSVPEQFHLDEAMKLDSTDGDLWRELATARLKRGLADEMHYYYGKAVKKKPLKWSGFRGYIYLYFYRDYVRAIEDFNYNDQLLGEVGYSQGQNHDYMRGIAYYGLKDYNNALYQLDKYIDKVTTEEGEEWVDVYAYLYRGLTLAKLNRLDEAFREFSITLRYYPNLSDCYYHKARILASDKKYQKAIDELSKAEEYFKQGYYHQRPYVEVLDQIYLQDIEELRDEINQKLFSMS